MTGIRSRMSTTRARLASVVMSAMIAGHWEAAYPEPANHFVARLLADLLHLIGSGIVGSMPLSRTQQQTVDLFQAASAQESCRTHTPARLTSAKQPAAVVSAAEELSSHTCCRETFPTRSSNPTTGSWTDFLRLPAMSCNVEASCSQVRQ